jgi:hypothetical protein
MLGLMILKLKLGLVVIMRAQIIMGEKYYLLLILMLLIEIIFGIIYQIILKLILKTLI